MSLELNKKSVEWFGKQMLKNLQANNNKRHWLRTSYAYLFNRLEEEVKELSDLFQDDKVPYKHKKVISECGDIGNIAMMIADKAKKGAIF